MCEQERLGFFHFWREVGRRMGIKGIPSDYTAFETYNREYERRHFQFNETNRRIGTATRELFVSWFPKPFAPLVRSAIHAMLDDPLIAAFGFAPPSRLMRKVPAALRLRGQFARYLPPRRRPRLRTEMKHPTYPDGYTIEGLGPSAEARAGVNPVPGAACRHASVSRSLSNGH